MKRKEELSRENLCRAFAGAGDFTCRELVFGGQKAYLFFLDGLVSGGDLSQYVLKPLMEQLRPEPPEEQYRKALYSCVYNATAKTCRNLEEAENDLVHGFCVLLFPEAGGLSFEVKTGEKRPPSAPEVENTVKGPKDAFVETVRINTGLVRKHLRSPDLEIREFSVGTRTRTGVSLVSLKGITNPEWVRKIRDRLESLKIDGLLAPAAAEEYLTGSRPTAFPLLQYTERPDRFCQGILNGRVGILIDGLPLGYLAPVTLGLLMESPEDRSTDYLSASFIRILRYLALGISLLLPGIYVAMCTFHQEMLPMALLKAVIRSKQEVPFSVTVEIMGLLIAFELLQESGIHLPHAVGQSVSVIGGIVVGTAAVEAKLVSPVALIAVSVAGICGFVQPNRDLSEAVRLWRLGIVLLAAAAGLFGVTAGLILLLIHLSWLTSFGVPYLSPLAQGNAGEILRKRLKFEKWRNPLMKPENRRNQI